MIEEQDEVIIEIEQKAEAVVQDMEIGQKEIATAVVSAKAARKKRKCCFVIILIILLIAVGVVLYIVLKYLPDQRKKEAADPAPSPGRRSIE